MGEGQRPAETAASLEISADAELLLAVGEQRFKLRIAFKAFRHIAHFRPCGFVSGHVACLILPLAGLIELLPAFHETVGASAGSEAHVGASSGSDFGFELKRADCAGGTAGARFTSEAVVLAVGGFRILPAVGSNLIKAAPCLAKLAPLFGGRRKTLMFGFNDGIGRASVAHKRVRAGLAQSRLGVFRHRPFHRVRFAPGRQTLDLLTIGVRYHF